MEKLFLVCSWRMLMLVKKVPTSENKVPNPIYLHPAIGYCEDTPAARVLEQLPLEVRSSRRW